LDALQIVPNHPITQEETTMLKVGKKAPEFKMKAYHQGGFKEIALSDYAGKWLVLYFYPGDFTFV